LDALSRDKKNVGHDLVLILPDEKAHVERVRVPLNNDFSVFFRRYLDNIGADIVLPS
jgi:hypothetical protein